MKSVGRPVKYTDENEKKEIRRIQNRENQRRCRKRKKLREEIDSYITHPNHKNEEYRNNLITFFNQFDFDHFFTGTIDPDYIEKKKRKERNKKIRYLNQIQETELGYEVEKKVRIKSLLKYTERYIEHLIDLNLIERCFVVFEVGKNRKYHIHILFKSNKNLIDFDKTLNKKWLIGNSKTEPIPTENDKFNVLNYCTKELNPTSKNIDDINKIENWFFSGNFNNEDKENKVVNEIYSPNTYF